MVVNNRIWIVGSVIVMVAVVLLGYFLGASPRLTEAATNEANRQAAIAQNQSYEAALAALKKDFENIEEFRDRLDELQVALPPNSGLNRFIGSLRDLEIASGVVLTKFASVDPLPFVYKETLEEAAAPVVAPEGEEGTEAPVAPAPVVDPPKLVQTLSPDEFVYIAISLEVSGTTEQILNFTEALQTAKRRFLVTSVSYSPDTANPGIYTGKVEGYVYVLLDPSKPAIEPPLEEGEEVEGGDESEEPVANPSSSPTAEEETVD